MVPSSPPIISLMSDFSDRHPQAEITTSMGNLAALDMSLAMMIQAAIDRPATLTTITATVLREALDNAEPLAFDIQHPATTITTIRLPTPALLVAIMACVYAQRGIRTGTLGVIAIEKRPGEPFVLSEEWDPIALLQQVTVSAREWIVAMDSERSGPLIEAMFQ